MSNRTGIREIDTVIEAFLGETITGCWDDVHDGTSIAVADLAYDPQMGPGSQPASGWCGAATRAFYFFLKEAGVASQTTDDDICGHFSMHGYADLPYGPINEYGDPVNEELSPSHCANVVLWDDHAYMIDWTASQYGYEQSPRVRRIDRASGHSLVAMGNEIDHSKWETEWETVEGMAWCPVLDALSGGELVSVTKVGAEAGLNRTEAFAALQRYVRWRWARGETAHVYSENFRITDEGRAALRRMNETRSEAA